VDGEGDWTETSQEADFNCGVIFAGGCGRPKTEGHILKVSQGAKAGACPGGQSELELARCVGRIRRDRLAPVLRPLVRGILADVADARASATPGSSDLELIEEDVSSNQGAYMKKIVLSLYMYRVTKCT
jgi:hypothetical protein